MLINVFGAWIMTTNILLMPMPSLLGNKMDYGTCLLKTSVGSVAYNDIPLNSNILGTGIAYNKHSCDEVAAEINKQLAKK